jgi:hypothetical protein
MTANQAMFPIHAMCNAFGVSRSGYYAWVGRRPSARANADVKIDRAHQGDPQGLEGDLWSTTHPR